MSLHGVEEGFVAARSDIVVFLETTVFGVVVFVV